MHSPTKTGSGHTGPTIQLIAMERQGGNVTDREHIASYIGSVPATSIL